MTPVDAVTRLESAQRLDRLVEPLRDAVRRLLPPGRVRDALHGVWLGHPVHPTLVQLSLGTLVSASVLDAVPGTGPAATALVATGLASTPATVATGWADWSELHEPQQRVGAAHAAANLAGLGLYGLSLVSRLRGAHGAGRSFGWAGLGALALGGLLGGHLSFRQSAGANHCEEVPHLVRPGWHDLCAVEELPEGRLTRRVLGGDNDDVPLVVLRRGDVVQVLAGRCSHLSAPLHEGELVAGGTCLRCPWHGSEFRLADGSVCRGPATASLPAFEVRLRDGRVEVCLPGAG